MSLITSLTAFLADRDSYPGHAEADGVYNVRPQMRRVLFPWLVVCGVCQAGYAGTPDLNIETTYQEHARGVELARAGDYDAGLAVLLPLLKRFPDDYPLQRDVILITIWQGDCQDALQRFERVRDHPDLEPYLVVPVSDCLLAANRPKEAHRLTRLALKRHPDDAPLRQAFLKADIALRVDANLDEESPSLDAELYNDSSDQGLTEWVGRLEGSTRVAEATRLYARYRFTRSTESLYRSGDFDRVGAGIRYRFDERFLLDQEFSGDLYQHGQSGARTRLTYEPRDAWQFALAYTSFAEDIPLRARAAGIDASRWSGDAAYEHRDYRLSWRASLDDYDFSDSNRRTAFYTTAGYAYEMRAGREQRLFVEWYQSSNSLDGAVYFNPRHDYSLGLTNRTDFVFDSRFRRHVDHLYLGANLYQQDGYGTRPRASLRYEQDYDFDATHALTAGAGLARNVYDGRYETDWQFTLHYHQRF